jgi:serine/threonine protein kinase
MSAHSEQGEPSFTAMGSSERTLVAGRFELLGLIGSGGMGSVYRARDRQLDEVVALKMISRDLARDPLMVERFRREVKLARRVTHRNVVRTFDLGEHDSQLFLTMELVEGESLGARLARGERLEGKEILTLAREVCAGLGAAHAAGVVHRDLKPDNVLLARDGRVVLTDFGIASAQQATASRKLTMGLVVGTAEYISPEQVQGRSDLDGRADIYALGAMLFELVTGRAAWVGASTLAVVTARLASPPPDPRTLATVNDRLSEIILSCMAPRREQRPETVEQLSDSIASVSLVRATAPLLLRESSRSERACPASSGAGQGAYCWRSFPARTAIGMARNRLACRSRSRQRSRGTGHRSRRGGRAVGQRRGSSRRHSPCPR